MTSSDYGRTLVDKLTAQAEGSHSAEASVLLLANAISGRLLPQLLLLYEDDTRAAIDWEATRSTLDYLSSGEGRILALADSLHTGRPIDLADALSGLDDHNARTVLRAIAHTMRIRIHGDGRR